MLQLTNAWKKKKTNAWFALVNHFFNDKSCIITCNKSVTLLFPGLSHDSIAQARQRGILTLAVRKNSPKNDGTVKGAGSLCSWGWAAVGSLPCMHQTPNGCPGLQGRILHHQSQRGEATNSTLTPRTAGGTVKVKNVTQSCLDFLWSHGL